jgi:hypothetical protein
MADKQLGEVLISRRTVRIGHQVYPLASISRVEVLRVVWGGKLATSYPLREIVILALVAGAIAVEDPGRQLVLGAAVLAGARIAWLLCMLGHRLLRRPLYTLVIEAAGTRYTVLSSTMPAEIDRLKWEIINAIDNPSAHRIVPLSGNVVFGDRHAPAGARPMTYTR